MKDGQNRKTEAEKANQIKEKKLQRYMDLSHAVQSGIAYTLALDHPEVEDINEDVNLREHKHLRTGIDTSKSDIGALAYLLIEKGVFTEDEYMDALILFMQREKERYEATLSAQYGKKVTLG
jgi:hypothetical protein